MSDSVTAVFSIGWLAGVLSATAIIGVMLHERRNKRKHSDHFICIDIIPGGNGCGSRNNGHADEIKQEVEKQAERLGVKIGE